MFDPVSWGFSWQFFLAAIGVGYLIGAIPFGLILTHLAGKGDIRAIGSGNIGATNVLRTGSKKLAIATLLLDAAKGGVVVAIGSYYFGQDIGWLAGLGAFLGHLFPIWLKFKGGKGVATSLGILFAIDITVGAATTATWLATALLFKYSSLAALVSLALAPLFGFFFIGIQALKFIAILSVISWIRHGDNIARLIKGQESKINLSKYTASGPSKQADSPSSDDATG